MAASRIESVISKAGTIAVFSKSYCPYCVRAKGILSGYKGVKPRLQIIELDHEKDGTAIQEALATKLGKSRVTVPQVKPDLSRLLVFINGKHVGGCDDLQRAQSSGELEKLLEELSKSEVAPA